MMQKMTGTQAILMPAHATKAHGVDGWAEEQMALRLELAQATATVAAEKEAAWTRYVNLAGRALEGGILADRRLFDAEWQRHLAQRAIAGD
jgi:hypothetical protein